MRGRTTLAKSRRVLVVGLLCAACAIAETSTDGSGLSEQALDVWSAEEGLPWRATMFLEGVDAFAAGTERTPAEAVSAVAAAYSVSRGAAVELVEVAIQLSLLDEESPQRPDPETVETRISRVAGELAEPLDRFEMRLRFYGLLPDDQDDAVAVASRAADVVAEAFEVELVDEIWPVVENWGDVDFELIEPLLAASPGHPALLAAVAESAWDQLDRATVYTYLWRSGAASEPFRALSSLLEAGAVSTAVSLWGDYVERDGPAVDLAEALSRASDAERGGRRGTVQTTLSESLPDSLAAALWLAGKKDEALRLMASARPLAAGPKPARPEPDAKRQDQETAEDPWQQFFDSDARWSEQTAAASRRRLLEDLVQPSERDPFDTAIELLRVRGEALGGHVLDGAVWPRVAAAWASQRGEFALERFFLIDARHKSRFLPSERARGRTIHWLPAVEKGLIPVDLYRLREQLYGEIEDSLERDLRRIRALDFTTAGFFEDQDGPRDLDAAIPDRLGPFSVRPGQRDSQATALTSADLGELPPTLPVAGDQVVDLFRDGDRWWLMHQGLGEQGLREQGLGEQGPGEQGPGDKGTSARQSHWHDWGYWLSTSSDGGHSWTPPVHTGLVGRDLLEAIPGSLAVESGSLFLRAKHVVSYPGMTLFFQREDSSKPFYELEADLSDLRLDSDGDGWTDVFESGMFTDPQSEDSDGDGLSDAVDPLPRHAYEPSRESEALDAALLEAVEMGGVADRLRRWRATGADAASDAGKLDPTKPLESVRWIGPDLPLATVAQGLQMVVLPEGLANDPESAGRLAPQLRLWIMNRTGDRALLVWSGFGYGTLEMALGETGWYPAAGQRGGGCLVTNVEPPPAELLRPME